MRLESSISRAMPPVRPGSSISDRPRRCARMEPVPRNTAGAARIEHLGPPSPMRQDRASPERCRRCGEDWTFPDRVRRSGEDLASPDRYRRCGEDRILFDRYRRRGWDRASGAVSPARPAGASRSRTAGALCALVIGSGRCRPGSEGSAPPAIMPETERSKSARWRALSGRPAIAPREVEAARAWYRPARRERPLRSRCSNGGRAGRRVVRLVRRAPS